MIPFAVACLGEAVGYGFRRVSADHPTGRKAGLTWVRSLFPSSTGVDVDWSAPLFLRRRFETLQYILQELFIILCPALMAASYYMCFGRTSFLPLLSFLSFPSSPSSRASSDAPSPLIRHHHLRWSQVDPDLAEMGHRDFRHRRRCFVLRSRRWRISLLER
jgi:hypothetical protein